ncbi:MAG: ATP-binding protein [Bacteroidota bacterium]
MDQNYSHARILIVDDQLANTTLLESFLKANGYTNYVTTNDAREVAQLVRETIPDLILLDIMMPHISGIEILQWLREEKYLDSPMRVMVLTADITKETLKQALNSGAHDMLRKPFDFTELDLRIKNLLHTNWLIKQLNDQSAHLAELVDERTQELVLKNDELEQFIYVASHDTQEPLRMVTGFLQLLEKKYGEQIDDKGKEYIHYAVDGAARMKTLIKEMLDFSRAGRIDAADLEWIDLDELLNDVLLGLKRLIESSGAKVSVEPLPKARGIAAPVRQVFQNLIINAITYQPDGQKAEVTISVDPESGENPSIMIRDNGIGIPEEQHKKIFDIFTRLHNKDKYPGSGVGLSISKKMMEKMGGAIGLTSVPGEGSTFYLHFPKG